MPTPCLWTARVWREYRAGNMTRAHRDVLLTLRTFRGHAGLCVPSHMTLADRARCSVRTVQRALRQAEHLGLVRWAERRVRAAWRWLRTSNRYLFAVPDAPVAAGMRLRPPPRPTTGLSGREGEVVKTTKKAALAELLLEAAGLPDLLARRRAAFLGGHGLVLEGFGA